MGKVENDVENTIRLVDGKFCENVDRIYFSSNENLKLLFDNINVKDKDVFCVLASSDQLFYSYYNGAKNVDTYDINKLTLYYYYLRKWVIQYSNCYYPDERLGNEYIYNILSKVKVKSQEEEDAYNYWMIYVRTVFNYMTHKIFFKSSYIDKNRISDVNKIKDIVSDIDLSFRNIDISSDDLNINKKYDVIITSNISEYFFDNVVKINNYRINMNNLLKEDGVIVSSLIFSNYVNSVEKKMFSKEYDIRELPYYRDDWGVCSSGYCYTKKVSTKKC